MKGNTLLRMGEEGWHLAGTRLLDVVAVARARAMAPNVFTLAGNWRG